MTSNTPSIPIVLTIAGSDSGGGAGIQADIKTISATGTYACSVITAITAQNTQGVIGIFPVSLEGIAQQIDAVFTDLDIIAVKVGMLADKEIIQLVAEKIQQYRPRFVVLDPVMVATSGDLLLELDAVETLKSVLLPLANIITPNLPEAATLLACEQPVSEQEIHSMVNALRKLNTGAVLLKGGHFMQTKQSNDLLILPDQTEVLQGKRIDTRNTHGTGCTLSSALASYLAQGHDLISASQLAKDYINKAILAADQLQVGKGCGPVHHFFAITQK